MARPTVIMKAALTLDGQMAAADGSSQWITGVEARRDAHRLRAAVDGVMVGAGTLIADDPLLTVRLEDHDGPQPAAVIVAGTRPLPPSARLFDRDPIVLTPRPLDVRGRVIVVPDEEGRRVDLAAGLDRIGELGLETLLVEGGAALLARLWAERLVDRGVIYYGQKVAGGIGKPLFSADWHSLDDARSVSIESAALVGGDVKVEFTVLP